MIIFNLFNFEASNFSIKSFRTLVKASDSDGIFGMSLCSIRETVSLIFVLAISVSKTAFWITLILGCISCTTKSSKDLFAALLDLFKEDEDEDCSVLIMLKTS